MCYTLYRNSGVQARGDVKSQFHLVTVTPGLHTLTDTVLRSLRWKIYIQTLNPSVRDATFFLFCHKINNTIFLYKRNIDKLKKNSYLVCKCFTKKRFPEMYSWIIANCHYFARPFFYILNYLRYITMLNNFLILILFLQIVWW